MRLKKTFVGLLLLASTITVPLLGQTAPLEEKQKAVLVFDMRMDLLLNSELAKSLNLAEQMSGFAAQQQGNAGSDPTEYKRIFGAISAPESVEAAQQIPAGGKSIDFFVKMQFANPSAATAAMESFLEKEPESFERDGKTYYRPPAEASAQMPENAVFHQVDATTLEFGTDTYIFHPNRQVFTDGLMAAWKKAPENEAIRLALDVEGAGPLLTELVEMGKQSDNAMVAGYLELVDNMKNVRLSLDFSGDNLLTLQSTGVDAEQADELASGLDAILGIAKMAGGAQVNQMKQQDPDSAAVMEAILKSLKANVEGDEVSVKVPKPAGFDAAVKKAASNLGMGGSPE